jgi:hypothetical protein
MRNAKRFILPAALGVAAIVTLPATAPPALAASARAVLAPTDLSSQQRRRIPRITVVPLSHYYRKCDFWLAVEQRPSGNVITPQQHCWWALR